MLWSKRLWHQLVHSHHFVFSVRRKHVNWHCRGEFSDSNVRPGTGNLHLTAYSAWRSSGGHITGLVDYGKELRCNANCNEFFMTLGLNVSATVTKHTTALTIAVLSAQIVPPWSQPQTSRVSQPYEAFSTLAPNISKPSKVEQYRSRTLRNWSISHTRRETLSMDSTRHYGLPRELHKSRP